MTGANNAPAMLQKSGGRTQLQGPKGTAMEQISYNNRAENDRTWAELLPLAKYRQIVPTIPADYFSVVNGRYHVQHWQHSTASQVRIDAVIGDEKLLVYREDKWVSGYESHNRGTIQGYQLEGPWVEQLEAERRDLNRAIDAHADTLRIAELRKRAAADQSEAAKIDRFTRAFSDERPVA